MDNTIEAYRKRRQARLDAIDFNEKDHPRDKGGKFTSKGNAGGGTSNSGSESKKESGGTNTSGGSKTASGGVSGGSAGVQMKKEKTPAINTPAAIELKNNLKSGKMTYDEIIDHPLIKEYKDKLKKSLGEPTDSGFYSNETVNISTPERQKMRDEIADRCANMGAFSGKDENGEEKFDGKVTKGFRAEIVLGAPAGGKSSVICNKSSQKYGARILDSDVVKTMLPEFNGGKSAGIVHEESSMVLNDMIVPQFEKGGEHNGDNIVIPIVGANPKKAKKYLEALSKAGYKVHLSFNDITEENSMQRAMVRFIDTGRFIDPAYIHSIGNNPRNTYMQLKDEGKFASYTYYDNNVKYGEPAKLIERLGEVD